MEKSAKDTYGCTVQRPPVKNEVWLQHNVQHISSEQKKKTNTVGLYSFVCILNRHAWYFRKLSMAVRAVASWEMDEGLRVCSRSHLR